MPGRILRLLLLTNGRAWATLPLRLALLIAGGGRLSIDVAFQHGLARKEATPDHAGGKGSLARTGLAVLLVFCLRIQNYYLRQNHESPYRYGG